MWIPKTESEINDVVERGDLEESATFDAKRELPSNNSEIAKDIAAMANDGGVLIYGIGEDKNKRLTELNPILLKGEAERITQIVQTSVSEPPRITISGIPTSQDPSKGYLVVVVPASIRAPHMVNAKNRYYGRSATGNIRLTEGEVARLYERRQRLEVDSNELLANEIRQAPLQSSDDFAYLHLIAQPVFRGENWVERLVVPETPQQILNRLLESASKLSVFPDYLSVTFPSSAQWKYRDEGLAAELGYAGAASEVLNLQVDYYRTIHLFCGRAGARMNQKKIFFQKRVENYITRSLVFSGEFYDRTNYLGLVDVGIGITGLEGAVPDIPDGCQLPVPYTRPDYRRTTRLSASNLSENAKAEARNLLIHLLKAMGALYSF
jgi:hypothetical protein